MNEFATFDMLPFIPLHFLRTHFWQLVHCNELLPTPLLQTLHGHLAAFCLSFWRSPLIITLVVFILTLMPLLSTLSFHSLSLLISSSSVSAVTAVLNCGQEPRRSDWQSAHYGGSYRCRLPVRIFSAATTQVDQTVVDAGCRKDAGPCIHQQSTRLL